MLSYISLLRGINVSGKNLLKMDALRAAYTSFGFTDVQSYIQSGNLVFRYKEMDIRILAKTIEEIILREFNLQVPVLVLTVSELSSILEGNPFLPDKSKDRTYMHISILSVLINEVESAPLQIPDYSPDEFFISQKAVYLFCPEGYGKTKLNNNFFEKKLKCKASTRNLKTLEELLRMAKNLS